MFGTKKPATTRPATPAWNPVNGVPPTGEYKPPVASRYMTMPADLSSVGALLPATKHAAFPPSAQLRELGLHELATAIDAHAAARSDLAHATGACDAARPPRGATWQAAVAETRNALQAGAADPGAPVRELLEARPARTAAAVVAAHRTNIAFAAVLEAATRADATAAEQALDQWTADAVDAVKSLNRGRLVQLEEDLTGAGRYSQLRSVWQWLSEGGRAPFQAVRSAVPQPVAVALFENSAEIQKLMGGSGLYSELALSQLAPSGNVTW